MRWSFVLIGVCFVAFHSEFVYGKGTTPDIEVIFKGRCEEFLQFRLEPDAPLSSRVLECDKVWEAFKGAFVNKNPCQVKATDYASFYNMTDQHLAPNKSLFWSGTYALSQKYSECGQKVYRIADTLTGYLVDKLTWCGSVTDPSGFNWTDCSGAHDQSMTCKGYGNTAFWTGASQRFAHGARGSIGLLLNGSNSGNREAYSSTSFFATVELPSLQPSLVTLVNIMVANDLGVTAKETCSTGSLLRLQSDVMKRGLSYSCVDNPKDIRYLQCANNPTNSECQVLLSSSWGLHRVGTGISNSWICFTVTLIAFVSVLANLV